MEDISTQSSKQENTVVKFLAWCVHFYTALGLVASAAMALLIVQGGPEGFRWAFVLMLAATVIDATDGTLARRIRIKEVLPGFDGRRLDDLVDFLNYTCLPLFLIWRAEILPGWQGLALVVALLASAYGFCQVHAKTGDGFFLGFPSLWNFVAFYLYILQPPTSVSLAIVLVLAGLTLVPTRYLYPTQPGRLNLFTSFLAVPWVVLAGCIIMLPKVDPSDSSLWVRRLGYCSLFFPAYYLIASWGISARLWLRTSADKEIAESQAEGAEISA
jgi:phosphatidylcholine synthase